jgi:hypothetical protein
MIKGGVDGDSRAEILAQALGAGFRDAPLTFWDRPFSEWCGYWTFRRCAAWSEHGLDSWFDVGYRLGRVSWLGYCASCQCHDGCS